MCTLLLKIAKFYVTCFITQRKWIIMQITQNYTSYRCSYPTFKAGIKLDDQKTEIAFDYLQRFDLLHTTDWCQRLVNDLKNIPCEDLLRFELYLHNPYECEITVTNTANNWASVFIQKLNKDWTYSYIDNNTSKVIFKTEKDKDKLPEAFYNYIMENKDYFFRNLSSTPDSAKLSIQA